MILKKFYVHVIDPIEFRFKHLLIQLHIIFFGTCTTMIVTETVFSFAWQRYIRVLESVIMPSIQTVECKKCESTIKMISPRERHAKNPNGTLLACPCLPARYPTPIPYIFTAWIIQPSLYPAPLLNPKYMLALYLYWRTAYISGLFAAYISSELCSSLSNIKVLVETDHHLLTIPTYKHSPTTGSLLYKVTGLH